MSGDSILAIDDSMLVDAGTRRKIYRHPEDENKILKVFWEDQMPARRRARLWYGRFKSLFRLSLFDNVAKGMKLGSPSPSMITSRNAPPSSSRTKIFSKCGSFVTT